MGGKAARKGKEQPKNGNRYSSTVNTEIQVVENSEREINTRMDDTTNYILEEYKMLREEIKEKTGQINSISIQMVVSVAALVGLGINMNIRVLFPVAAVLTLFMYYRILYYNKAIARISAYMIVHLEPKMDIWWETGNYEKDQLENGKRINEEDKNKIKAELSKNDKASCTGLIEPLFLQLICLGLWITFSVRNHVLCKLNILSFLQIVCLLGCVFLTTRYAKADRAYHNGEKGDWILIWETYFGEKRKTNIPSHLE